MNEPEWSDFPHIIPAFDVSEGSTHHHYFQAIPQTLKKILPCNFFNKFTGGQGSEEQYAEWNRLLPMVSHSSFNEVPFNLSVYLLAKRRPNAFKFFLEMISHWLLPGKRLNVVLFYAVDFCLPDLSSDIYMLCEVMIQIETEQQLEAVQKNLSIMETEVRLGIASAYHARRILEIRGLSVDEKTALIQEYIAHLVKRFPNDFDYDLFSEMQHVLVTCRDDFKAIHESRHIARLISIHYLFRNDLRDAVRQAPDRRHLRLKIARTKLHQSDGVKTVLALMVGVNFLNNNEVFEERHLIKAVCTYIPDAEAVEGSFFINQRGSEKIATLYLEVTKNNGQAFSSKEISRLRHELPSDLKDRIQQLMHPVFMPSNEEEIMRNILTLSSQVRFTRDIPQVMISFDKQADVSLAFSVIFVRVLRSGDQPIQELFKNSGSCLRYVHERCKTVGYLRKKYPKEATVFNLRLPKERFLRGDHSIDLYKARQMVVRELERVVGEFRDFNGGMISKQNELFGVLRDLLQEEEVKYNDLLLENFFYSLTPVVMRSILEPGPLKILFLMFLEAIEIGFMQEKKYSLAIQEKDNHVFVMITSDNRAIKEDMTRALNKLNIPFHNLASAFVTVYDTPCLGYIFQGGDDISRQRFCEAVKNAIEMRDQNVVETIS